MKKKIGSIVTALLLTFSLGSVVFAGNAISSSSKVTYKANEITDLKLLFEKAKERKTDLPENTPRKAALLKDGESKDIQVYQTTQRLQVVKDTKTNNNIRESYVTYEFYNVPKDALKEGTISTLGSKEDEKWDSSYSVKAYSTYYFDRYYDQNGLPYRDLTKVSGGWVIDDSSVAVTNKEVWFGASGGALRTDGTAGGTVIQDSPHYFPTSLSFSYSAPSSWRPVADSASSIGVTTKATLKRNTSTWTLQFANSN
ncbi:hypothetical protein [Brevibacillus brevis]|uniref:hypothetical protein n=1 Tax=Brevibacillus brevis TaxID=1393 RepID=UPI001C8EFAA6|nr:hypothetical protein [Brevibacillus brevis]MBY0085790.1 hypothetical protein [Brevibacillus brevis]